jgi:DNA uptake protein ComE-like DNA-binding protein
LDINTASLDELARVPAMPQGLPEEIIRYRDQWGGFTSLSELRTAVGIDSATEKHLAKYLKIVK